jgi:hypothetical protein
MLTKTASGTDVSPRVCLGNFVLRPSQGPASPGITNLCQAQEFVAYYTSDNQAQLFADIDIVIAFAQNAYQELGPLNWVMPKKEAPLPTTNSFSNSVTTPWRLKIEKFREVGHLYQMAGEKPIPEASVAKATQFLDCIDRYKKCPDMSVYTTAEGCLAFDLTVDDKEICFIFSDSGTVFYADADDDGKTFPDSLNVEQILSEVQIFH